MVKFETYVNGAMWFLDKFSVTESISGSVVPLAMFQCLFNCPKTAKTVDIMKCLEMDLGVSVVKKHFFGGIPFESYIIRI